MHLKAKGGAKVQGRLEKVVKAAGLYRQILRRRGFVGWTRVGGDIC